MKNSGEVLDKLKARYFNATSLSTYAFTSLYTTLSRYLIKKIVGSNIFFSAVY